MPTLCRLKVHPPFAPSFLSAPSSLSHHPSRTQAHFYSDPTDLFRSASYNASGMLMFRDRLQRHLRGQPIKDASRYVRHLIRKRMASQSFLPDIDVSWPWRPSEDLIRL